MSPTRYDHTLRKHFFDFVFFPFGLVNNDEWDLQAPQRAAKLWHLEVWSFWDRKRLYFRIEADDARIHLAWCRCRGWSRQAEQCPQHTRRSSRMWGCTCNLVHICIFSVVLVFFPDIWYFSQFAPSSSPQPRTSSPKRYMVWPLYCRESVSFGSCRYGRYIFDFFPCSSPWNWTTGCVPLYYYPPSKIIHRIWDLSCRQHPNFLIRCPHQTLSNHWHLFSCRGRAWW